MIAFIRKHKVRFIMFFAVFILPVTVTANTQASPEIEFAGDVLQYALPITAAGFTALHKDGYGAVQFAESAALTLSTTYILKYSVNETRPNGGNYSFPSGHSSISFSSAEFIRKRYGWGYGIPAYAAAAFTAYSRVESKKHYTKDVLAGGAVGIISSYIFTKPFKGWHIRAGADDKGYRIKLCRIW